MDETSVYQQGSLNNDASLAHHVIIVRDTPPCIIMRAVSILPGIDSIRLPNGKRLKNMHHAYHGSRHYLQKIRVVVLKIWQNADEGDTGLDALKSPTIQSNPSATQIFSHRPVQAMHHNPRRR